MTTLASQELISRYTSNCRWKLFREHIKPWSQALKRYRRENVNGSVLVSRFFDNLTDNGAEVNGFVVCVCNFLAEIFFKVKLMTLDGRWYFWLQKLLVEVDMNKEVQSLLVSTLKAFKNILNLTTLTTKSRLKYFKVDKKLIFFSSRIIKNRDENEQ